MADLDLIIELLNSSDNDKRNQGVNQLADYLIESPDVDQPDQLIQSLKPIVHSQNAHHAAPAIAVLPRLFNSLVPHLATEAESTPLRREPSASSSVAPTLPHHSPATISHLKQALVALLPLDRLGDTKERLREVAREAVVSAGRASLRLGVKAGSGTVGGKEREGPWAYLSRVVEESGFSSKNSKAREQAVHYLIALRDSTASHPLPPLRPFTPFLLPLLSDSDAAVRALALKATIDIFSAPSVSPAAKADLKREMAKRDVNKKVQDTVLAAILGGGLERSTSSTSLASGSAASTAPAGHNGSTGELSDDGSAATSTTPRTKLTSSTGRAAGRSAGGATHSPLAALPAAAFLADPSAAPGPILEISPVYIASEKDLASEFDQMKSGFEGRESEHNWMLRDKSVAIIRGMIQASVHHDFADPFLAGIKSVQEGILKTASSLRTTVATSALSLLTELSTAYGHRLDPFLELFLSHTLGMAGQTKKLVAAASQATATALITNSAYHHKTVQLIWQTVSDKIVSARQFGAAHVSTFVKVHARPSKHAIEASGGLDDLEKCLKKGLEDANPGVKEATRAAFWETEAVWPEMAARVMDGLDPKNKKQLEGVKPGASNAAGPAAAKPAAAKVARPSVRAMMMQAKAQKQAEEAAAAASDATQSDSTTPTTAEAPRAHESPSVARMATGGTPIRARPSNSGPTPSPSIRRDSHPASPPSSIPKPASPRLGRPSSAKTQPLGDNGSLLDYTSPFMQDGPDPSLDFADSSTQNHKISVPVAEVVVPEALQAQAAQAEQAAQRLLELGDSESEADVEHTPLGPGGQVVGLAGRKGQSWAQRTPITKRFLGGDVFEDSPDPRNGASGSSHGKTNWWANRLVGQSTTAPAEPLSNEREVEIEQLISALQAGQVDKAGLGKLGALSRERPTREELVDGTACSNDSAAEFWDDEARFTRVYEGLAKLLTAPGQDEELRNGALGTLRALVENQFSAFVGDEAGLVGLLFRLREDSGRTSIAATDLIAAALGRQIEPLFGLGLVLAALAGLAGQASASGLTDPQRRAYGLGMHLTGRCLALLPKEVVEEEFPRARALILGALNDRVSGDLRRSAVECLTEVNVVVGDEEWIFRAMDGLVPNQMNLLSYYFSKHPRGFAQAAGVGAAGQE